MFLNYPGQKIFFSFFHPNPVNHKIEKNFENFFFQFFNFLSVVVETINRHTTYQISAQLVNLKRISIEKTRVSTNSLIRKIWIKFLRIMIGVWKLLFYYQKRGTFKLMYVSELSRTENIFFIFSLNPVNHKIEENPKKNIPIRRIWLKPLNNILET